MYTDNPRVIHGEDITRLYGMRLERRTIEVPMLLPPVEEATLATTMENKVLLHMIVELDDSRQYDDNPDRFILNSMPPMILSVEPLPAEAISGEATEISAVAGTTDTSTASAPDAGNASGKGNGKQKASGFSAPPAPTPPAEGAAPSATGTSAPDGGSEATAPTANG